MNETPDKRPRKNRLLRAGAWGIAVCVAVVAAAALALLTVIGTRVSAPDWLRDEITQRFNQDFDQFTIGVSGISVVMHDDWIPQLRMSGLVLSDRTGAPLASLAEVHSSVALRPLLRGDFRPGSIRLVGARVILRRAADGSVGLTLGDDAPAVREAPGIAALIGQLDNVLREPRFRSLTAIEVENVTLRYEDARVGRAWTVDGGRLALTRSGSDLRVRGDFALLGGRDYATTLEMNYAGRIGETASEFGINIEDMPARDIAGQSPALAWLEAVNAPISGALRGSVDQDGALGPLNATLQIGAGVLQPTEVTKPIAFDSARTYFTYSPARQIIAFDEVALNSKWASVSAEGEALLVGAEAGWPREFLGQIRISEILANPDGLYDKAIGIDEATVALRLRLDPFELRIGEMSIVDQGSAAILDGTMRAEAEGWTVALNGRMDRLGPERLMELWPAKLEPKTRSWIEENVREADLSDLQFALRSRPDSKPDIFLGFDFAGLKTEFMKDMPSIEDGAGHASLVGERFVIAAERGYVQAAQGGRIDITGTSFVVPDVNIRRGPAQVRLKTASTITAALSLLDEKPFRFLEKAGQPVTLADGRARLDGQLDFRLIQGLQAEDVDFEIEGTLSDVRSESLVDGRILAAKELTLTAGSGRLEIGGEGRIGRVPFEGRWSGGIGPESGGTSRIEGQVELSERFADEFRIGLPPGGISGAGKADIEIAFERGQPGQFRLSSDLDGVGLRLQQLDWTLPQSTTGELEVTGRLGEPPSLEQVRLEGAGLSARGSVQLREDGQLDRASFTQVEVGTWIDAPVELVGRGAGQVPMVRVLGGKIDLRQTSLAGRGSEGDRPARRGGPVSVVLDTLQISEGIALTNFRAELDMSRGADGSFRGLVNDRTQISGRVVPQRGRSAFRIQSEDAGGVLLSAGLLKQARGGKMDLVLTPGKAAGTYDGSLEVENMRLKDAPSIAALLNALSVVGLLEQLDGEGIHFSQVDARFQLSPERVTLYSGSAVGASMGISMDGYYFMGSGQMDMQGVVSPLYLVNAVGGLFTRRGEGLIGFNYELKGPASAPTVQVNPLSVLTPGMFRELFRRPAPRREGEAPGGAAAAGAAQDDTPSRMDGRPER